MKLRKKRASISSTARPAGWEKNSTEGEGATGRGMGNFDARDFWRKGRTWFQDQFKKINRKLTLGDDFERFGRGKEL